MSKNSLYVGRASSGYSMEVVISNALLNSFTSAEIIGSSICIDAETRNRSQIDMLLITTHKIYCIEIKNINIALMGNLDEPIWKAKTNTKGFVEIKNPVKQNEAHIQALQSHFKVAGLRPPEIENVIVVSDKSNVKVVSNATNIYTLPQFIDKIREDLKGKPIYHPVRTKETFKVITKGV